MQNTLTCSMCQLQFGCGAASGNCWCMDVALVQKIPNELKGCLCPECLKTFSADKVESPLLAETEDFYLENGFMVFTEKYLLKRGYCCKNNCRHCPY
ncbi:MAG: cysteine-rich CWC family protein [Bdellovibrionaceae bacterium]|nr:cysteine-rich CWC family protein [Pseudobdellovibrionaceae bacterium]